MLIHHQCERNKGSQAALAQVSRPSVGHELPSVSLNTDADVLFEHISGRNPIVGDALIFQDIQVDSQSNCTQTFFSTAAADSPALVISPARNRFHRTLGQRVMASDVFQAAHRTFSV